jgi:hypothetical protein
MLDDADLLIHVPQSHAGKQAAKPSPEVGHRGPVAGFLCHADQALRYLTVLWNPSAFPFGWALPRILCGWVQCRQ